MKMAYALTLTGVAFVLVGCSGSVDQAESVTVTETVTETLVATETSVETETVTATVAAPQSQDSEPPSPVESDAPTATDASSAPTGGGVTEVIVSDHGWTDVADSFVSWGAVVSSDRLFDYESLEVHAVARDSEGQILDSDNVYLGFIRSGEDVSIGGNLTDALGVSTVDVEISDPGTKHDGRGIAETVEVSASFLPYEDDLRDVSLELTNNTDLTLKDTTPISMVFRDDSGEIVGGSVTYSEGLLGPGETREWVGIAWAPGSATSVDAQVEMHPDNFAN